MSFDHSALLRRRAVLSIVCVCLLFVLAETSALAEIRLPAHFSSHAVLQRDRPLPVWGWGEPGEVITVVLGESKEQTKADENGVWKLTLPAQEMSVEPLTMTISGSSTIELTDLLIGDVWLCSGQSNMEFPLGACDAQSDIEVADFPQIRHFGVAYHFASSPQTNVEGNWQVCSPQTAAGFTAVGFYFAREVHQRTGVPIGLLRSSVGGTNIECWMSQETLLSTPALEPYAAIMRQSLADYQVELSEALPQIENWFQQSREAQASGVPLPLPPAWPDFPFGEKRHRPRCVTLHNGMIHPLKGTALRGVLWYQGENNAGSPFDCDQYIEKKRAMIADWRRWFGDDELPFYFVQLAAWQNPSDDPARVDGWAFLRDAQRRCLEIPFTGMASAIDLGDAADIHPKNKYDVGLRLARWALNDQYDQPQVVSGPLYRSHSVQGNEIHLEFDYADEGLMVGRKIGRDATQESPDESLRRFAIAGEDRQWKWAEARIEGSSVIVSHPEIAQPVAVRYAFDINPEGANLYNRVGLPASPFRTDNW